MAKIKLVVDNRQDLQSLKNRVRVVRIQREQFQLITFRKLAEQIIQKGIHQRMADRGFSQKIIDGTRLTRVETKGTRKVTIFIVSTLFAETGFDVALAREKGTRFGVFVEPVKKQALRFIANGNIAFSKGHFRDGMIAFKTVASTIDELKGSVQDNYNRELIKWLKSNLGGAVV